MADLKAGLRWLVESRSPGGAEDLIERLEAEMAGDPLIVVTQRRKGYTMTKTDEQVKGSVPGLGRGLGWAVAAFVVVLAVAGLYLFFADDAPEVADPTPPLTDLEIIKAGVDALYSGDAELAVELFELTMFGPSDDWIRSEVAYQAVLKGQTTVECQERDTPGVFTCTWSYHNAIGDAIGYVESSRDIVRVDVEDGLIVQFGQFPFKDFGEDPLIGSLETFLNQVAESGDLDGSTCEFRWPYGGRGDGDRFTPECVDYVMEHLDDWAAANSE